MLPLYQKGRRAGGTSKIRRRRTSSAASIAYHERQCFQTPKSDLGSRGHRRSEPACEGPSCGFSQLQKSPPPRSHGASLGRSSSRPGCVSWRRGQRRGPGKNAPFPKPSGFLAASDALNAVDVALIAKRNSPSVGRLFADATLAGAFQMMSV